MQLRPRACFKTKKNSDYRIRIKQKSLRNKLEQKSYVAGQSNISPFMMLRLQRGFLPSIPLISSGKQLYANYKKIIFWSWTFNCVRFIRHFEFCLVEGPGPEEENQQLTHSWSQHNQEKFVCCAWWSPFPAAMTPGLKREFKGTVSRDGFGF